MRTSKKTLSISLLLLLVPTGVLVWLGLSEFSRLESQVRAEMTSGLQDELRATERELASRIRARVAALADDLTGRPLEEILREIAQPDVADGYATPGTLLFRDTLEAIWPVHSSRSQNLGTRLVPTSVRLRHRELARRLAECEFLVTRGMLQDACEHLVDWKSPHSAPDAVARLELERARLLFARERFERAEQHLELAAGAIAKLKRTTRRRGGIAALDLLIRYFRARVAWRRLGEREGASAAARAPVERTSVELLDAIARGDFDPESDAWLDRMFALVRELLDGSGERVRETVAEIAAHRRWHVATRKLQEQVIDRDLARLETSKSELVLYTILQESASTLVAFVPIEILAARTPRRAWIGKVVHLERVVAPVAADVQERLAEKARDYSLVVVDANGRAIAPRAPDADPATHDATTRRALGGALLGLTLELRPDDLASMRASTRRGILVKSSLLLGLLLLAGVGAFLLLRSVRRESELADLRTSFVGRVSHELKTPLALIRMYGETIAMGRVQDPEKTVEFGRIITTESSRLTDMIDRVLDFSKIEAGGRSYAPTRLDVGALVRRVSSEYRPHLEAQGCELHVDVAPELFADVEGQGLEQALVNLLSNARKYSDEDKRIDVEVARDGDDVVLRVRDRGIGVPDAEREKIFETFYRSSTAGERRGAGIGLALVRHFAEAHGGSCRCLPNPAEGEPGTTFELRIPLARDPDRNPS